VIFAEVDCPVVTTDHVGTAAVGCPAEPSSLFGIDNNSVELRSTGQPVGGCPHVVCGYAARGRWPFAGAGVTDVSTLVPAARVK
jgi:hypothetical protein